MDYRIFQTNLHDSHTVTKYCIGICLAQFIAIMFLTVLSINLSHRSVVTLVPMNVNAPLSVSNNAVSSDYLEKSALSFINLRLNFDPDTIDQNHDLILRFAASSAYKQLKNALDTEASLVKTQGISSNFYINNVEINRSTLAVQVSGKLARSVGNKSLPTVNAQFLIAFKNNDGFLSINKFVEEKHSEQ